MPVNYSILGYDASLSFASLLSLLALPGLPSPIGITDICADTGPTGQKTKTKFNSGYQPARAVSDPVLGRGGARVPHLLGFLYDGRL